MREARDLSSITDTGHHVATQLWKPEYLERKDSEGVDVFRNGKEACRMEVVIVGLNMRGWRVC